MRSLLRGSAAPTALLTSLLAAACGTPASGETAARPIDAVVPVRLADVALDSAPLAVTGVGVVSAREEVPLAFKTGGVIADVRVRDGDAVRAGQPLATLDVREIDALVTRARAAVAKAERDDARARALYRDSVATLAQAQDAATALELARADLQAVGVNRRYAAIVAPADGTVLRRLAEPGQTVGPGTPVLLVGSATSGMVVRVGLPDRDAVRVRLGDPATVQLDAYPERELAGTVRQIAGAASPGTGTYEVQVALASPAGLRSGLVARVRLQPRGGERTATVPIEALVEADGDRATVFALGADGVRARRLAVEIAELRGTRVAVRRGLAGVTRVVTEGAPYLDEGTPVRVLPSAPDVTSTPPAPVAVAPR
jgi:RND family efflux transporter MFP subunit